VREAARAVSGAQEIAGQKEMDVVGQQRNTKGFRANGENRKHVQRIAEDFVNERLISLHLGNPATTRELSELEHKQSPTQPWLRG
jgi:hypothetical protein